jgi:hypothetical protein
VRQHHAVGVAAAAHLDHGVGARLEGGVLVEAEPVHAQDEPGVGELGEMVAVGGVAAVPENGPGRLDAFLIAHHLLDQGSGPGSRVGVDGDRRPGALVGAGDGTHHSLDARRQPLMVDRALEHPGLDAGAGYAVGEVGDEHVDHRVRDLGAEHGVEGRPAVGEEERDAVVGVEPGRHDDVELRHLLGDPLDTRDVPAEPDHRRVDDRFDTLHGEGAQLGDRVRDPLVLVAPFAGMVQLNVGGEDENVLVHVGPAEFGGVHGALDGVDETHARSSFLRILPVGPTGRAPRKRISRGYL